MDTSSRDWRGDFFFPQLILLLSWVLGSLSFTLVFFPLFSSLPCKCSSSLRSALAPFRQDASSFFTSSLLECMLSSRSCSAALRSVFCPLLVVAVGIPLTSGIVFSYSNKQVNSLFAFPLLSQSFPIAIHFPLESSSKPGILILS